MDNIQDIDNIDNQQELDLQVLEAEELEQEIEQNSQRMISIQDQHIPAQNIPEQLKAVKNPVSPYMVFISSWKQRHPEQKFSVTAMGQIWKAMGLPEKEPFITQYRQKRKIYQQHLAALQLQNPGQPVREAGNKSWIPLQRVRSILRQDDFYAPKTEAYPAMAKAAEYFAEYMLEELKRMSEGKSRIDHGLLYDCINNQRSFSFLQCLIEEHNRDGSEIKEKKNKPEVRLELEEPVVKNNKPIAYNSIIKPQPILAPKKGTTGQMSLEAFFVKQR